MSSTGAAIQVGEFVRALALSWKNLAAYPAGHPALVSSLHLADQRLKELRGPAGEVVLGISMDGLLYGDTKIESASAQKFAQALYGRGVAIVRFTTDTRSTDLEAFLRLLAQGAARDQKRALWDDLTSAGVININLQPVNYSAVHLTDSLDEVKTEPREGSLWDEILRALLEGRQFSGNRSFPTSVHSADELWQMIAQLTAEKETQAAFDPDATFGIRVPIRQQSDVFYAYLAETIGNAITQATLLKKQNSLEQAIQLLRTLPEPVRGMVLRSVLDALASDERAGAVLRDFASELPQDEVLDALRYLSSMGKLSPHALMLLQALAPLEPSARPETGSADLISELVQLFGEDDIDRFNPSDHQAVLQTVAIRIPQIPPEAFSSMEKAGTSLDSVEAPVVTQRFAVTVLELIEDLGTSRPPQTALKRLTTLFRSDVAAKSFDEALDLMQKLRDIAERTNNAELRRTISELLPFLGDDETLQELVDVLPNLPPEKAAGVHKMIETFGAGARKNLVLILAEESNRSRRRRLLNLLSSMGPAIVPEVTTFLSDSRWYVVRNMIMLLRAVGDSSSLPELRKLATHADLRVRLEAIKTLFALGAGVPPEMLDELISNPDPKLAEKAITLVGSYGIKEAVDPLLRLITGNDVFGARRNLRLKALRALGDLGEPRALDHLQRFFKATMLPWPSIEERRVAWESLNSYPRDARQQFVEKGLRSRDSKIREICEQLART